MELMQVEMLLKHLFHRTSFSNVYAETCFMCFMQSLQKTFAYIFRHGWTRNAKPLFKWISPFVVWDVGLASCSRFRTMNIYSNCSTRATDTEWPCAVTPLWNISPDCIRRMCEPNWQEKTLARCLFYVMRALKVLDFSQSRVSEGLNQYFCVKTASSQHAVLLCKSEVLMAQ